MAHRFLYIVDPLANLSPPSDTTLAIMEEAESRGIESYACEIQDIVSDCGALAFYCAPVSLKRGYSEPPRYLAPPQLRFVDEFSAVFMRKDPPVDQAFFTAILMLRKFNLQKTIMVNHPDGILRANEKLFGLQIANEFFPKTLVASSKTLLLDFIRDHKTVVLKPLFASGGSGVLVFEYNDRNLLSALELLSQSFQRPVMVQEYIAHARKGDKRVIILGGKAVGAILRVPSEHDHRANLHAGGTALATELTDQEQKIIEALAPELVNFGLHLVGLDIIGGFLTEINVTSPTGVIDIERFSKNNGERPLRAQIVDYVEKLLA